MYFNPAKTNKFSCTTGRSIAPLTVTGGTIVNVLWTGTNKWLSCSLGRTVVPLNVAGETIINALWTRTNS